MGSQTIKYTQENGKSLLTEAGNIMQTSPCNEYPLTPHFYIVKLGFTGVYIFLIFALKHRLWVLVRTGGSNVYSQSMF